MVLRKTGCDEIMLNLFFLSYILMRTRGPYDCSWILENIESVFFYTCDFCILGLTTVHSLCCRIFEKSKGVILIEK